MTSTAYLASVAVVTVLGSVAGASRAAAEPAVSASRFHADVEIDPTAYALRGYSLHVGLGWQRLRVDLGAFAMALPGVVQTDDDFDVSFDGFGAKLQYFPFAEQRGGFVGVDAGVARPLVERVGTDLAVKNTEVSAGVNAGWRFDITAGFYAAAWLGVGYSFGAEDVMLDGETYEAQRVIVFPAVHLGYRVK